MDVDASSDLEEALKTFGDASSVWLLGGEGAKTHPAFRAFTAAAEHFRGRMVFAWAPGNEDTSEFRLYKGSVNDAELLPQKSLAGADELVAWLDERVGQKPS